MAAPKPLGALMNDSVEFFKKHLTTLLVGAVVFSIISYGAGVVLMGSAFGAVGGNMAWQQQLETTGARMKELQQKAMTGEMNDADQVEMEALAKQMMGSAASMGGFWKILLPAIGMSLLITIVIAIIAKSYFLVIAVKGMTDAGVAFRTAIQWIFPLLGLWIWLILRTFIWIPFLGIVLAIILGPRFILSPLYLLEQKKGVMESASLSYKATSGHWGKIFGNALLLGILIMILSMIIAAIVGMIFGSMVMALMMGIISELLGAFMVIFAMQLARTVMAAGART